MGIKWTNQAIHFIHCTVKELNIGVLLNISFAKIAYKLISLLQKIKTALILKIGTERRLTTWKAFCMVFVSWHLVFRMNKSPMIGLQFFICQKIILSVNGAVAWTMDNGHLFQWFHRQFISLSGLRVSPYWYKCLLFNVVFIKLHM